MSSVRQGRSTTTPVSLYFQLWYMYVIWGIADRYFPNYKSTMYNYIQSSERRALLHDNCRQGCNWLVAGTKS